MIDVRVAASYPYAFAYARKLSRAHYTWDDALAEAKKHVNAGCNELEIQIYRDLEVSEIMPIEKFWELGVPLAFVGMRETRAYKQVAWLRERE